MALALSKAGADIILVQRNTTNTTTKEIIEQAGGKADIVVCDLASKEDVAKLIPHVTGELKRTLDIVVNCGMSLFRWIWGGADVKVVFRDDIQLRTSLMMIGKKFYKSTWIPYSKSLVMPVRPPLSNVGNGSDE
jgi:NAD(P)-dependent dehydrogenase (short-subunit alcohol dehydrogenase family)